MIESLKPVSVAPSPCKICSGPAQLYGVVDFHKSCDEARGRRMVLSGVPIYYRRCTACKFLYTDAFDDWSIEQFKAHIYNDEYEKVDPDYRSVRPNANAEAVARLWGERKEQMRVLDYGGGNDAFCAALRTAGFPVAVTYDPMVTQYVQRPEEKFDLVTCFETLEHLPDPAAGVAAIHECVADQGLVLFTTYLQPAEFDQIGLGWWYVGPRNGHISIFSRPALASAFGQHGYKLVSFSDNIHLAYRNLPPYLSHLQIRK